MRCDYYDARQCRSCTWIETPYAQQLEDKRRHVGDLLAPVAPELHWLPTVASSETGFRTKAKMVVAGTVTGPTIGILDAHGEGQDLQDCPLYPPALASAFSPLAAFITRASLEPYSVPHRRGELKHLLVTLAPDGSLMVRWVLRSTEALARIRKHLPWLHEQLPGLAVASVNVHPDHAAIVEGEREILLTQRETLEMSVNGIPLHLRPQSFFQTNTDVAATLYRQAAAWIDEAAPASLWDLYCGVGGFALHAAAPGRTVTGVETSEQAVASALRTRDELRARGREDMGDVDFVADDAVSWAAGQADAPEAIVVNPPRRGLGQQLSLTLGASGADTIVYSSCNADTLARDLAWMPSYRAVEARLFDMFPHTAHGEVGVLLRRA